MMCWELDSLGSTNPMRVCCIGWGPEGLEKPNCRIISLNAVKCQVMCKSA